jgi:osmotically-inducible protein OsmY
VGSAGIGSGGVAVQDAALTLCGHAPTCAEKLAAVRAAERVDGNHAYRRRDQCPFAGQPKDDFEIARAIAHVLEWNTQIPEGKVHAQVRAGWVMLDGEVEYAYQRHEVERIVRHVRGVVGITNNILIVPRVSADQVEAKIEEAFRRDAEVDARHITIEISDHTAKLYGNVRSLREATDAAAAAAAAPGVSAVESHLVVTP